MLVLHWYLQKTNEATEVYKERSRWAISMIQTSERNTFPRSTSNPVNFRQNG